MFGSWAPRYFVLDSDKKTITYFQEMAKLNPKGEYKFDNRSSCKECENVAQHEHCFKLIGHSSNRQENNELFMSAQNSEIKRK